MDRVQDLKNQLKRRLGTLVDVDALRRDMPDPILKIQPGNFSDIASPRSAESKSIEQRRAFGKAMLFLSILLAIIGLYVSPDDITGRIVFLLGALLYAGVGAWFTDSAKRY
jgi:hypothetical protein